MKWIEASIETKTEEIDELCEFLTLEGVDAISIEDEKDFQSFLKNNKQYWDYVDQELLIKYLGTSRIKFYLEDSINGQQLLLRIKQKLNRAMETHTIDDQDWENSWQKFYQPIEIGKKLLITPEWLNPNPGKRKILRLDPGLAFGTGSHPTTQMCLTAMEKIPLRGKKVLDIGCGSGILGIGAMVLGAARVDGCDVDPLAPDAARSNAKLNGISLENYRITAGDILNDRKLQQKYEKKYDLVLANIVADVILKLSPMVKNYMFKDGSYICSGIIEERADEVEDCLNSLYYVRSHVKQEEWHCFVCENPEQSVSG